MTNDWEKQSELLIWKNQGRTTEQVYGVANFLTGQGGLMIERMKQEARKEERKAVLEEVEKGMLGIAFYKKRATSDWRLVQEPNGPEEIRTQILSFLTSLQEHE